MHGAAWRLAIWTFLLVVPALAGGTPVGPDPARLTGRLGDSRKQAREALVAAIDDAVGRAGVEEARVGIHVVSVETGEEIYAKNADGLLNPASNMKLFTTAAALELLGPDFRFETEVYVDRPPDANGVVHGNIYVKGKGDPTFVSERMHRLVTDLWHLGLRRVTGTIVVDDSYFDDVREGPGWEQEHSDRAYVAPTGALSLNFNAVAIHVRPGRRPGLPAVVTVDPDSDYFVVENRVRTVSARRRRRHIPASIGLGSRQKILVRGFEPVGRDGRVYYRRIDNPPLYFGHTFRAYLKRRGVRMGRTVRKGVVPPEAHLLVRSYSETLASIVRKLNKVSNNHIAEMLLKTLGAEIEGTPGSWAGGVAAVEDFLEREVGIPRGSYVMKNGSGLNDTNRVSARQVTRLLRHMWHHFQVRPEFVSSLPIVGRDGTAAFRLEDTVAAGVMRAKTGTLENVSALSGYVATAAGEVLAFSILVNDHPGRYTEVVSAVDTIAEAIAAYGLPPGAASPAALATSPLPTPPRGLHERVRVYRSLGAEADARNVRFLRSALRTESDPVVRAVIAEALYRSDPEQGGRLLVEAFRPEAAFLRQLSAIAHEDREGPTPVLSALVDLAAEGRREAIARLVAAVHWTVEDERLYGEIAEGLSEVGRTAPEELLAVLVTSEDEVARTAVAALVQGTPPAERAAHPLFEALRREQPADEEDDRAARLEWLAALADSGLREISGGETGATREASTPTGFVRSSDSGPPVNSTEAAAGEDDALPGGGGGGF